MPALNAIEDGFNQSLDFLDAATMDQALAVLWSLAENSASGRALRRRKEQT